MWYSGRGPLGIKMTWCSARAIFYTLCMALVAATYIPHASAQGELPADVRADIFQRKVLHSERANDLQGALAEIDEYKSLKVPIPPAVLLGEAKAAWAADRYDDNVSDMFNCMSSLIVL
jgi:hypothetical protein